MRKPKHGTFHVKSQEMRRWLFELDHPGASMLIHTPGLYFQQPDPSTIRRCKNMGLLLRETEKLGTFKVTRIE